MGTTALVTGAWRGIGAAVCRGFAREGASVAINYPPNNATARERGESLASDLEGEGRRALALEADVSDRGSVSEMVARAEETLGPVTVLVINAAATGRLSWTAIKEDAWRHVMDVNTMGALLCAQAVYPGMRSAGRGKIITVSSIMASLGSPRALHYVTSKAAIVGFTRALAREVGSEGICVNCVMPGAIRTESEEELYPGQSAATAALATERQSVPRRGMPDDIVGSFVFLASAESDFITGQVLVVDGGWFNY